jgi:PTS system mannitol-specific IIC component
MLADLKHLPGNSMRARVQRFGGNLAGMIMPNIAAFIAWGLITALFIPTGWLPNARLALLVSPMITYLLPILIGYTGGRLVHGQRGAVVGAIATVGVVVGTDVPMFLGAMIIGPLTAFLLKQVDAALVPRIRTGFEMLVNNFSAGILGGAMAIGGLLGIGPVVQWLTRIAGNAVHTLVDNSLLPLVSIVVEPAKVLFLNNAINHGVLSPLAVAEAADKGKSVLFMIETNPGPGLGILTAYLLFGPRTLRPTVPGAMIIHFLGGIHEIYFPYVLMKPRMILAAIAGGAAGVGTAVITNAGLVATPSPGSIFAYLAVTPKGGYFGVLAAIVVAFGVAFVVGAALLGFGRAQEPVAEPAVAGPVVATEAAEPHEIVAGKRITRLVVACDAGMGSSVMLASQMRKRLAPYGVTVEHKPVNEIPADAELVLTHADLATRAQGVVPGAVVVSFRSFMGDPAFDRVEAMVRDGAEVRA